ncbi:hypothetical protein ACOMHN_060623 [Nucella lapillus]
MVEPVDETSCGNGSQVCSQEGCGTPLKTHGKASDGETIDLVSKGRHQAATDASRDTEADFKELNLKSVVEGPRRVQFRRGAVSCVIEVFFIQHATDKLIGRQVSLSSDKLIGRQVSLSSDKLIGRQVSLSSDKLIGKQVSLSSDKLIGRQVSLSSDKLIGRQVSLSSDKLIGRQVSLSSDKLIGRQVSLSSDKLIGRQVSLSSSALKDTRYGMNGPSAE